MENIKQIYQYSDNLLFSVVEPLILSPFDRGSDIGRIVEFLCPKHRIRLTNIGLGPTHKIGYKLICPICRVDKDYHPVRSSTETIESLEKEALALCDKDIYKEAKLIRLDDYYVPEISKFDALPHSTKYSIKADVKTDKDGDTIVILYLGYKGKKEKTQIFIKPEKLQLSHDHKDLDPKKILAKIELKLKDRNISQEYRDDDE